MVKETALNAIKTGSIAAVIGEAAIVAEEIPNKEAMGLTQTPTQAPPLQAEKRIGRIELRLPVIVVQIVFLEVMINLFLV